MKISKYVVVFEREADGRIIASVPGVPGCHVYGRSRRSALKRVRKALEFFVQELAGIGQPLPRQEHPATVQIRIGV
ncbi:MAG: type II toxin-antitoxin system HicB family antitoxin [Nitrospirae bacterium]|nr:type II toxin-antitoxin system HicB family antitoxin [Nitrospirota bacterium]